MKCAVVRRQALSDDLMRLASRLERLHLSLRNPERYHEDKDEIAKEIRRVAEAVSQGYGAPYGAPYGAHGVRRNRSGVAHG